MKVIFKRYSLLFLAIIAIALPAAALFPTNYFLYGDYVDAHWMARYFSEFFKTHGALPHTYNTFRSVGLVWPVFYGFLLFPLIAFLGKLMTVDLAFRVLFISVWVLEFLFVYILVYKITKKQLLAFIVSCLCIWTIYPLTNLYGRGAVGEFSAAGLFLSALCCWFLFLFEENKKLRIGYSLLMGLFITLGMASHSISLVFGACFFLATGLSSLPIIYAKNKKDRNQYLLLILINVILCAVILSPWLYATLTFSKQLGASKLGYVSYWRDTIDSIIGRFSPLPIQWKYFYKLESGETYIDAQVNTPLLVFVFWQIYSFYKSSNLKLGKSPLRLLFYTAIGLFLAFTIISLNHSHSGAIAAIAKYAQFNFRFTTYINLAIFSIFICLLILKPKLEIPRSLLVVCFSLSLIGCISKLIPAFTQYRYLPETITATEPYLSFEKDKNKILAYPFSSYGYFAIRDSQIAHINKIEEQNSESLVLPVLGSEYFGVVPHLKVNVKGSKPKWFKTNIFLFPWVHTYLDGIKVVFEKLRALDLTTAVQVPTGEHSLSMAFEPPSIWLFLNKLSLFIFILWSSVTLFFYSVIFYRRVT